MISNFYSPLRYPGGKARVVNYFKSIIDKNNLINGTYIEPYAGGASVALSLLLDKYVSNIIINDKDISIYSFWFSIINDTDKFLKLVYDTPISMSVLEKQRAIQKDKDNQDLLNLGFSTFYLNRCNRGGIINAGVIGGKEQSGKWKMDARFKKDKLVKKIEEIANYSSKIKIFNLDAIDLIKNIKSKLSNDSIYFFDPPYYIKGSMLYMNHYKPADHVSIASYIQSINKQYWVVTYDYVLPIVKLYYTYRFKKYTLHYSIRQHCEGEEVMIFSNNLQIPKFKL